MTDAESISANLSGRRNVTIEISSNTSSYVFLDPKIYTESGHCHVPPGPTIGPMQVEMCNFSKTSAKATGAVGLLSYDIVSIQGQAKFVGKLVIMFSVPHDRAMYKNWFGFGIFDKDTEVDEALYKKMYYDKDQQDFVREEACGSALIYDHERFDVMGTMSPLGRSIMKVELWEKMFNPPKSQRPY